MRPFTYQAPASVDDTLAILATHPKARLMAGGTDLLVQLRRGLADADCIIDVKRIPELNAISVDQAGGVSIGAAVTCACLCQHVDVRQVHPGLIDAISIIGGAAIQGRATIGGNLCNAAPSADSVPALIVLRAMCTIVGLHGTRSVPVEGFCIAPGKTVLAPNEMLISIHVPPAPPCSGACYLRFTPRHEMDIAVVGAAAWVMLTPDGAAIADARIALSAVAPTPLFVRSAGDSLIGHAPSEEVLAGAASIAREAAQPITDVRGTAAQRRHLVGVLVRRALRGAVNRARGLDRGVQEGE